MARVFITGSADGLGQLSAKLLIEQGHNVVLHARNADRAKHAVRQVPGAEEVLIADLRETAETKKLAEQVNGLGAFDAVIHNAGVYNTSGKEIFAVNTLAPFILTALIQQPERLVYLSSGMHLQGHANLDLFKTDVGRISYSDSKLHVLMLSKVVAEKWKGIYSNTLDPGWVPTRMGGQGAPDDLRRGYETQTWLAVSNDDKAKVSGKYFYHQKEKRCNPLADDAHLRNEFIKRCEEITGVLFPVGG